MNTVFPRLPTLQSIGRSSGIDMEDPPEDTHVGDDNDKNQLLRSCNTESLNVLINKFESTFTTLHPGDYFCNKFSTKLKNPSLMHCWKGAEVVKHVHKIKQLMILKSRMEFQKDVIICLETANRLEELIKKTVLSEMDMWDDICHNRIHRPIRTNLIELSDLCDDIRVQVNFWSSIWKRLFCSSQIKNIFGEVSNIMRKMRTHFDRINLNCFSWLGRLVIIGFRVLAHCDLDRIEYESLCNIAKGLEDYNLLVANFKFSSKRFGDGSIIPQHISSMKLSGLLEILAQERSKYSAISCKEYLFGSLDFLKEVQNCNFKKTGWLGSFKSERNKDTSKVMDVCPIPGMTRITESLFSSYPPILDFIRREKGFIENLLHAVCHVTTLLTLEDWGHSNEGNHETSDRSYVTTTDSILTFVRSSSDIPSSSDGSKTSKKKSVSWNDSLLATQANSMASKYFMEIWQCFVGNFVAFMEGFYWTGARIGGDHLGCLVLSDDVVSYLVSHILHVSTHKGLFPTVIHPHLSELSLRYLILPSQNTWKTNTSSCHRSQQDMLQNVSNSLIPFEAIFESLQDYLEFFGQTSVHKAPIRLSRSFFHLYQSVITSFLFTCSECIGLCQENILQSLAQSDLQLFLSCSRSNLKVLFFQLEEAFNASMKVSNSVEFVCGDPYLPKDGGGCILVQHLKNISDEVNFLQDKLKDLSNMASISFKELSSKNSIQFFKNNMPTGKAWKRKDEQTQQHRHNDYIEKGVDLLLKPVVLASKNVDDSERLEVMAIVIDELCTAWMNNILDKKIKFSYHGACQLERDMMHLRSTLSSLQNPMLTSKLLHMDIFDYMKSIVGLLKQQPNKASPNQNNNSASEASSKSNSSKSGSKSNSTENSPLAIKTNDDQSPKDSTPLTMGASNGAPQQRRPSKKSRSSNRSNASRDEKCDKTSKANQDMRPKFGRSAKVSTNSVETPEVQNNRAFIRDEDKSVDNLIGLNDVLKDSILTNKTSAIHSGIPVSPNGKGPPVLSNNKLVNEFEVNVTLIEQKDYCNAQTSGRSKVKQMSPLSTEDNKTLDSNVGDDNSGEDLSDVDVKDSSPSQNDRTIARKDEWLALRVRRGSRAWPRLPLCFSGSVDSCGS